MPKFTGMYIHQHWSYNHPYAARTWSIEDWRGYLDGLHRLGYDLIQIWPVLETVPNPMTPSDTANIERIAEVIKMAHRDFGMRVFIVICPNIVAHDEQARDFSFEDRPFFLCDDRIDPGDPAALAEMMAWREELLSPLADMDGLSIIDSDPGGFPGSRNHEFAYLMGAHRRMLNRLRRGIDLVYWHHSGWEAYARFYETAHHVEGPDAEIEDAVRQLAKMDLEPWSILTWNSRRVAEPAGQYDRCIRIMYGTVEDEPSFPLTNFEGPRAERVYDAAANGDPRGAMANAQSHCLQLPNTLAFARAARGRRTTHADYVAFCDELMPGHGDHIVRAWGALAGHDARAMRQEAHDLEGMSQSPPTAGQLQGLLFGDGRRFLTDLAYQLRVVAALEDFAAAAESESDAMAESFPPFVDAITAWQDRHGYKNQWQWPRLDTALRWLGDASIDSVLDSREYRAEGSTPFEQVQQGFRAVEDLTPRLLAAMKAAAATAYRSGSA